MEGGRIRKSPSSSDRGLVGKSPMTAPDRGSVRTSTADRGHTRQSPASAHGRGYAHKSPTRNPGPGDRSVASTSPVHPGNRCMGSPVRSAQALPSTSSTPQHGIRTPGSSRSRSPVKRKTPMSASEDVFGTTEKSHNAFSVGEGSSSASARRRAALQQEVQAVSHAQGPAVHTIDLPSLPQAAPPAPAEPELGTQDDYDLDWDLDALADIDETALFKATETIVSSPNCIADFRNTRCATPPRLHLRQDINQHHGLAVSSRASTKAYLTPFPTRLIANPPRNGAK